MNQRWREYAGLSPEDLQGWGWQVAIHPEDLPSLMRRWRELLIAGEPGEIEARMRRHDGIFRWFLIRFEPFRDETGKVVIAMCTAMCNAKEVQAQKNDWRIFVRAAVLVAAIPAVVARKLWITNVKTFSTIA